MGTASHDIEAIKYRLRGLASKTTDAGCTEAEAMMAAAKLGELLDKYNLTMADLTTEEMKRQSCIEVRFNSGSSKYTHLRNVVSAIAKFCDCKSWFTLPRDGSPQHFVFFGLEADATACLYLIRLIQSAMLHEAGKFHRSPEYRGRASMDSFKEGFTRRVAIRLHEMRVSRKAEAPKAGNALVVVKDQLVTEEFAKQNLKLRTVASKDVNHLDRDAYRRGVAAGNNVNLHNGPLLKK